MKRPFPRMLGLIPARMGSKGVPGKNARMLGGKPLVQYTIEAAKQSRLLDKVIVSTDCHDIAGIAKRFTKVAVLFPRPASLATDEAAMAGVMLHALAYAQREWGGFEYVVLLQPTSPFRMPGLIDGAIRRVVEEGADSLVSLRKIPPAFHPSWAYWCQNGRFQRIMEDAAGHATRRQDLPETYYRDGQIYITRSSFVEQGLITGGSISVWLNDDDFGVNIDTMADWLQAENLLDKWIKATKSAC